MSANCVGKLIKSIVSSNKVAVFSKSYCPYCKLAKNVLYNEGVHKPFVMELDHRNDSNEIQTELTRITKTSTVPYIFINKKYIGGGTTLEALSKEGKLQTLLADNNL